MLSQILPPPRVTPRPSLTSARAGFTAEPAVQQVRARADGGAVVSVTPATPPREEAVQHVRLRADGGVVVTLCDSVEEEAAASTKRAIGGRPCMRPPR